MHIHKYIYIYIYMHTSCIASRWLSLLNESIARSLTARIRVLSLYYVYLRVYVYVWKEEKVREERVRHSNSVMTMSLLVFLLNSSSQPSDGACSRRQSGGIAPPSTIKSWTLLLTRAENRRPERASIFERTEKRE